MFWIREVKMLYFWSLQARPLLTRALEENNFETLVDQHLQNNFNPSEMARMVACAAACVRHSARRRPRMSQVINCYSILHWTLNCYSSLIGILALEDTPKS